MTHTEQELKEILDALADAQKLIFSEKNWSKHCTAITKNGEQVPSWDRHAAAWSLYGSVEKTLFDKDTYKYMAYTSALLEKLADEPILTYDFHHNHSDIIELFYTAMVSIGNDIGVNVYTQMFPEEGSDEYPVFFVSKEFDEELERSHREAEERHKEARRRDDELWRYTLDWDA